MTLSDIAHGPRDRPLPMVARAARTHELDVPAEFESIKSPEELHGRAGEHLEIGSCEAREQQQVHKGRTLPLARVLNTRAPVWRKTARHDRWRARW
jgi:hypothetical protein